MTEDTALPHDERPVDPVAAPSAPRWDPIAAVVFGWRAIAANPWIVLHLLVAALAANALVIVVLLAALALGMRGRSLDTVRVLVQIANIPIALWITMGMVRYLLRVVRGQEVRPDVLFAGGPFLTFLGAYVLVLVAVTVGMVLCIVPGVILALGLHFYVQEIVDRGRSIEESLRGSWELMRGHKTMLFVFWLLSLVVNVAGLMACGVGVLVTSALTLVAASWIYVRLRGESPPEPGPPAWAARPA